MQAVELLLGCRQVCRGLHLATTATRRRSEVKCEGQKKKKVEGFNKLIHCVLSHRSQYKTLPALVVYVFWHTGSRINMFVSGASVSTWAKKYVTRTYHLFKNFLHHRRTWFHLYCKCDIFIFLYLCKMYWIHYKDEGILFQWVAF